MRITYENYGQLAITFHFDDGDANTYAEIGGYTLKECMMFIENRLNDQPHITSADVWDMTTGEIIMTVYPDESEDPEEEPTEWNEDCGFNPYEGCYDYDC